MNFLTPKGYVSIKGQGSLASCCPLVCKESDMAEQKQQQQIIISNKAKAEKHQVQQRRNEKRRRNTELTGMLVREKTSWICYCYWRDISERRQLQKGSVLGEWSGNFTNSTFINQLNSSFPFFFFLVTGNAPKVHPGRSFSGGHSSLIPTV